MVYDVSQLQRGDLVFYDYSPGHEMRDGHYIGHVGIYLGDGQIIDSIPGGVATRDVNYMTFAGGGAWPGPTGSLWDGPDWNGEQ